MLADGAPSKAKKGKQYFRASYLTLKKAAELKTMSNPALIVGVGFGDKFEANGLLSSKCTPFCATRVRKRWGCGPSHACMAERVQQAHAVSPRDVCTCVLAERRGALCWAKKRKHFHRPSFFLAGGEIPEFAPLLPCSISTWVRPHRHSNRTCTPTHTGVGSQRKH